MTAATRFLGKASHVRRKTELLGMLAPTGIDSFGTRYACLLRATACVLQCSCYDFALVDCFQGWDHYQGFGSPPGFKVIVRVLVLMLHGPREDNRICKMKIQ